MNSGSPLIRKQMDRKLDSFRPLLVQGKPAKGWIQAVREALGMSTYALARRLNLSQASVSAMEKRESEGRVTLNQLEKVAQAMGCKVVYALVPKHSLEATLKAAAEEKASAVLGSVEHSMALENQAVNPEMARDQREELVRDLLRQPSRIWE